MLGRHWPGSEGNLASDLENKDDAVTTATPDANTQEAAKPEGKPESGRRAKAAADKDKTPEAKPPVESAPAAANADPPPAETKEAEPPPQQQQPSGRMFDNRRRA